MDQNLFSTKQILATANSNKTQEILSYKKLDGKMMTHTHQSSKAHGLTCQF